MLGGSVPDSPYLVGDSDGSNSSSQEELSIPQTDTEGITELKKAISARSEFVHAG